MGTKINGFLKFLNTNEMLSLGNSEVPLNCCMKANVEFLMDPIKSKAKREDILYLLNIILVLISLQVPPNGL